MFAAWMLALVPAGNPLIVTPESVDAGRVFVGQTVVGRFRFHNAGHDEIKITDLRASCGCAAPRLDRRTLAAGDSLELALEVNTLSQPAGPIRWALVITYRRGDVEQRATLELTAELIREIDLEPASLALVAAPGFSHEVVLTDRRPKPLSITGARTDTPYLQIERLPSGVGDPSRRIRIRVADACPPGVIADTLRITTDDPKYAELRVPIHLTCKGHARIVSSPARAYVSPGRSMLVQLRSTTDESVEIAEIECGHPTLRTRWAAGPGRLATLRISLDTSQWNGLPLESEIRVSFSSPNGEKIVIPVTCRDD